MVALVIAEHDNMSLKSATLNTVSAAIAGGGDVHMLVAGSSCDAVACQAAGVAGVSRVLVADALHLKDGLPENVAEQVLAVASDYVLIAAPATAWGKAVAPRVAARLDVSQVSEITKVVSTDTFERPIYAGNAIATIKSTERINVITVRTTGFDAAPENGGNAEIVSLTPVDDLEKSAFVSREVAKSDRPDLSAASIVVSGGRGLGSGENYKTVLEPLADKLGAALGASRAAVDAGFVPNDYQVGQTGKIVAPQLYLAVGISGAIQHLAGMKDSKVIVAVNKDAEAPIFQVADFGLVGDLFDEIPKIVEQLG